MSDPESPPRPLNYAEPALTKGIAFHRLAYPTDHAGFFNPGRVILEGDLVRLEPAPIILRTVCICIGLAAYVAWSSYRPIHRRFEFPFVPSIIATIVAAYMFRTAWHRQRTPWIVIDQKSRMLYLPRAATAIRFKDVVRLQIVSFTPEGVSRNYLSYRSNAPPAELQIAFNDRQREETWCVVAWPDQRLIDRFVQSFKGIPVARARLLVSGEWSVERVDSP